MLSTALRMENGVWTAGAAAALSYPQDGNQSCFQVEDGSYWFHHRNDCIAAAVKRFPPGGTLLDVGGGNGFVTRRLLDEGFDAVLLEPGPVGAMNALRNRAIREVVCCSLDEAQFVPGSFAGVGAFDVIEHVDDDAAFVSQLHRLMGPGGLLYLTVPAHGWLWSTSDELAGHFRRYTLSSLRRLLARQFEVLYDTYFFGSLVVPVVLVRVLPYYLGLRSRAALTTASEHGNGGGPLVAALRCLLAPEVRRIHYGKTGQLGTSALLVARRI